MEIKITSRKTVKKRSPWILTSILLAGTGAGLLALLALAAGNLKVFDEVEVVAGTFSEHKANFGVTLDLRIANNQREAIDSVHLYVCRKRDGRTVPDVETLVSHRFQGGLEPGESAVIQLYASFDDRVTSPVYVGVVEEPVKSLAAMFREQRPMKPLHEQFKNASMVRLTEK